MRRVSNGTSPVGGAMCTKNKLNRYDYGIFAGVSVMVASAAALGVAAGEIPIEYLVVTLGATGLVIGAILVCGAVMMHHAKQQRLAEQEIEEAADLPRLDKRRF